jgi:membrane protease YdiL (CAAX protease family)
MDVFLEFASRGRNDWWRYLLSPALAMLLTMMIGVGLTLLLVFTHALPAGFAAQIQQPENVAPFFLGLAVTFGLLTACLMLGNRIVHRKRPGDVIGRWRWKFFAFGFVIWIVVQSLLTSVDFLIAPHGFALSASHGTVSLAGVALVGILVQTFAEEFIFRGYATQGLLLVLKKPLRAAVVSGLLFGAVHIPNGIPQALNATVFGIVCALIAIRSGGIALTAGLHLANNYFGAVIVVSGSDVFHGSPGVISQITPQLIWGDICLAAVALGAVGWLVLSKPIFSGQPAS